MSSRTCVTVDAGHRGVQRGADGARVEADQARLVLVDADAQLARRLHPVEVHPLARRGSAAIDLRELQRDLVHLVRVGPAHAVLHRPADRRAELERRDARHGVRELLGQQLLEPACEPLARLEVLGHDHDWVKKSFGELDVERQVEADRAAADVGAPVRDVRVASARTASSRLADRLGSRRSRRSAAGSGRPAARAGRTAGRTAAARAGWPRWRRRSRERERDGEPSRAHRRDQQAACKPRISRPGSAAPASARASSGARRRGAARRSPRPARRHQRDPDHGEDREGVLAGRAAREADGHEAGDGDKLPASIGAASVR